MSKMFYQSRFNSLLGRDGMDGWQTEKLLICSVRFYEDETPLVSSILLVMLDVKHNWSITNENHKTSLRIRSIPCPSHPSWEIASISMHIETGGYGIISLRRLVWREHRTLWRSGLFILYRLWGWWSIESQRTQTDLNPPRLDSLTSLLYKPSQCKTFKPLTSHKFYYKTFQFCSEFEFLLTFQPKAHQTQALSSINVVPSSKLTHLPTQLLGNFKAILVKLMSKALASETKKKAKFSRLNN